MAKVVGNSSKTFPGFPPGSSSPRLRLTKESLLFTQRRPSWIGEPPILRALRSSKLRSYRQGHFDHPHLPRDIRGVRRAHSAGVHGRGVFNGEVELTRSGGAVLWVRTRGRAVVPGTAPREPSGTRPSRAVDLGVEPRLAHRFGQPCGVRGAAGRGDGARGSRAILRNVHRPRPLQAGQRHQGARRR